MADEPLIVYPKSPRPSYADQTLSFFRDAGIEPRIAMEAKELQTALGLVASGGGICIVPASVRRLQRYGVAYRPLDKSPLHVRMGVVWHDKTENAVVGGFVKVAEEAEHADSR